MLIVSPRLENKLTTSCCVAGVDVFLVIALDKDSVIDLAIWGFLFKVLGYGFLNQS